MHTPIRLPRPVVHDTNTTKGRQPRTIRFAVVVAGAPLNLRRRTFCQSECSETVGKFFLSDSPSMECVLLKKTQFSGWSPRCYRLTGCQLIQYKRGITDIAKCSDKNIKRRYNIRHIRSLKMDIDNAYTLVIGFETPGRAQPNEQMVLRFENKRDMEEPHLLFKAWYRILSAMTQPRNTQCLQRPLPSNLCSALYFVLQGLHAHEQLFSSGDIFARADRQITEQKDEHLRPRTRKSVRRSRPRTSWREWRT